jgi:hypothetical protein
LQRLADACDISILAEVGDTYCFRPDRRRDGPFHQVFAYSKEGPNREIKEVATKDNVQEVISYFGNKNPKQHRVIQVGGTHIGILLCGENLILRGGQPRFPKVDYGPLHAYDVLINPSHSIMTRFFTLPEKFEYFSRENRFAFYCTNCYFERRRPCTDLWERTLLLYHNGERVEIGNLEDHHTLPRPIQQDPNLGMVDGQKNWRLLTVEIP